jgi:hypothetical protein
MLNFFGGGHPLTVLASCPLQTLVRSQRGKAAGLALLIHKADNLLLVARNKGALGLRKPACGKPEQQ